MVYGFSVGQKVLRRQRAFSKLDPRSSGPLTIERIRGLYNQRIKVSFTTADGRKRTNEVHASQLTPFLPPYLEGADVHISAEPNDLRIAKKAEKDKPQRNPKRARRA